ncbi:MULTISPECIES: antitoxin Xre/MbcA/ParS toxin-binding domain-containing protein [unclassified Bradyrhizobium]
MSAQPLAEAYERLKELRRQGDSNGDIDSMLQSMRDDVAAQSLVEPTLAPEGLVRAIEIKTLADRVFGDQKKAITWLKRPNATLSGQRPIDLLKDELGTAVVREMLERIDHGIFA